MRLVTVAIFCSLLVLPRSQAGAWERDAAGAGERQADAAAAADEAPVDFIKDIKPLLAGHCNDCHGSDKPQSGFRTDAAALLLKGGDRGQVVVPGKADESLLYQALAGTEDVPRMPMDLPPLEPKQIAAIKRWIDAGAKIPESELNAVVGRRQSDHWAFQPVRPPDPPAVKNRAWVRTPIDAFILARLEKEGLEPSAEADRSTLIRRLSLDLRGTLPSPDELEQFLTDEKQGAYERLVDRLLDSPQYGERWARQWLDTARYADSNGFTIDGPRDIWPYRDWVIQALNSDMPFDRFTIEQIAGDLLPGATRDQLVATGFHRNTLINQEGGTDKEQFRVEAVVDRVSTTAAVFLGLTIGCAQCHEHKYDPFSQRDFYELYAFFNSNEDVNSIAPTLALPNSEQETEQNRLKEELAAAEKALKEHDAEIAKGRPEWERTMAAAPAVEWTPLDPAEFVSAENATINKLDGNSLIVGGNGNIPASDVYTIVADVPLEQIGAIRLEALTNPGLPNNGPGLADDGSFVLSEFEVTAESREPGAKAQKGAESQEPRAKGQNSGSQPSALSPQPAQSQPAKLQLVRGVTDWAQTGFPAAQAIDGNVKTGWAIGVGKDQGDLNVNREAIFVAKDPVGFVGGTRLTIKLTQKHTVAKSLIGCFRLSVAATVTADQPLIADSIRQLLMVPEAERTAPQKLQIAEAYARADTTRQPFEARLAALKKQEAELRAAIPTTMIMRDLAQPRETHIQIRGDFLRLGARVSPGVPEVLPPLPEGTEHPTRLDLARWLVSANNPLTPRVTVNRFWQAFFGIGLVDTENDFGLQGSLPSHPELLDWLAAQFVAGGWKVKDLHRLIVHSATYRQASNVSAGHLGRDPQNRLLARQSRVRLEAETIRDACLSASGLLSHKVGGPGVYPPQPAGINLFTQVTKQWPEAKDEDRFRRGLYIYFWRSNPYPFLMTFDAPQANTTCTRRTRSNTPLQALTLANDQAFFEFAQGLAVRILTSGPDYDEGRIRYAFRACLSREPNDIELKRLSEFLDAQREHFKSVPESAKSAAPATLAGNLDIAEAAAWTTLSRVMLNLDEFITRE